MKITMKPRDIQLSSESKPMVMLSTCIMPIALLGLWVAIVTSILIPS